MTEQLSHELFTTPADAEGTPKFTRATRAEPSIGAAPLTQLEPPRQVSTGGRPKKLAAMPYMEGLSDVERVQFDGFIDEYLQTYPDLLPTDYRMLYLAATEYIKYLRITNNELKSGTVMAMSRTHPAVNMRSLLDQLSVTRRARARTKPEEPESEELKDFFMRLGTPAGKH